VSLADAAVGTLLVVGVGLVLLACLGALAMRDVYDRLHYTGSASLGALAIAAAIVARESFSLVGDKAILLAVFLLVTSPVLVSVTARAARLREHGEWSLRPDEGVEVEEG
jgi:multicomponent Na+:H+ antiporter subunit G